MRWLIIVLFLVSFGSACMAGVGDDYYCDMISITKILDEKGYSAFKDACPVSVVMKWFAIVVVIEFVGAVSQDKKQ